MKTPRSSYLIPHTSYLSRRGFTLVELMVSIGIFAMMTALVVAKYSNFNGSVLMTNLAYDVALTIRTAQTYGLSVKNNDPSNSDLSSSFKYGYGVHFDTRGNANKQIILFADKNGDQQYSGIGENISIYNVKRGATINKLCANVGCSGGPNNTKDLDIIFIRPDPKAIICLYDKMGDPCGPVDVSNIVPYIEIVMQGSDSNPINARTIIVRENGQISVKQ